MRKVCIYTGINLIQAAKKEIFMNYGADKKVAPEIKITFIFMRIGFELSVVKLSLVDFKSVSRSNFCHSVVINIRIKIAYHKIQ